MRFFQDSLFTIRFSHLPLALPNQMFSPHHPVSPIIPTTISHPNLTPYYNFPSLNTPHSIPSPSHAPLIPSHPTLHPSSPPTPQSIPP
ncbi:hypothetical protein Pmani_037245 [Petrolisthes manimaculis]|uniref:Uncharacterized protein n=1 Tax=Petrolisthes manimaculis TaxID=1843537 RepID=A0AAE1NI30_9EUCA|nr:hypothetical protein Pmani_037245 [Petrolisthes manimaculis]